MTYLTFPRTMLIGPIDNRVRSFDNTRSETIQFHTPLTLIVGYNGSGKTVSLDGIDNRRAEADRYRQSSSA